MNLAPALCRLLRQAGHDAVHWSDLGPPAASDAELMAWARDHGAVVLTHDLDFGILLALTRAAGPSVVQLRIQDVMPDVVAPLVLAAVARFGSELEAGALVTIQPDRHRARVLPLRPPAR